METQLTLLETAPWRLDDRTRTLGRQRVAEARAALRAARAHAHQDTANDHEDSRTAA